ncbi:hypothetical protein BGZ94_000015 [Podila epigama]|nr:hypothetical protein BGZ94_000015 [Podila epigama]
MSKESLEIQCQSESKMASSSRIANPDHTLHKPTTPRSDRSNLEQDVSPSSLDGGSSTTKSTKSTKSAEDVGKPSPASTATSQDNGHQAPIRQLEQQQTTDPDHGLEDNQGQSHKVSTQNTIPTDTQTSKRKADTVAETSDRAMTHDDYKARKKDKQWKRKQRKLEKMHQWKKDAGIE